MSLFIFKLLCCYQEEMDIQVLRFQNKKLSERLEERKVEEENLKIQIEEYKKKERDNTELLSVILQLFLATFPGQNVQPKSNLKRSVYCQNQIWSAILKIWSAI